MPDSARCPTGNGAIPPQQDPIAAPEPDPTSLQLLLTAPASPPPHLMATTGFRCCNSQLRILHHPVVDPAIAQADDVERVILVQPPRPLRALLGHLCDRTLHIAGG